MPIRQSPITTHVLDTARGLPARGVPVTLELLTPGKRPRILGRSVTDTDGRVTDLLRVSHPLESGEYRLTFDIAVYYHESNTTSFYSQIQIQFTVSDTSPHYHVPLLLSPFGYSTYRGS